MKRSLLAGLVPLAVLVACSNEAEPSKGSYTVQFPSTAAAIATDFVQVLIFDVKTPQERVRLCGDLIAARLTDPTTLKPSVNPPTPAANICQMKAGRTEFPLDIPYGEHALLAIAQKKVSNAGDQLRDFMIGCSIMTVGEGDTPIPIPLRLVSVNQPVPATKCGSVSEFCERRCQ